MTAITRVPRHVANVQLTASPGGRVAASVSRGTCWSTVVLMVASLFGPCPRDHGRRV